MHRIKLRPIFFLSDEEEAKAAAAAKTKKGKKGKKGGGGSKDDATSQADREAMRKIREEKKRKQIAMQRKLVRQARARQQAEKKGATGKAGGNKQGVKFEGKDGKDQGKGGGDGKGGEGKGDKKQEDEKDVTFKKMFRNKRWEPVPVFNKRQKNSSISLKSPHWLPSGATEGSEETKHWRGKRLFVNNGLPLQCFVCQNLPMPLTAMLN